MDRRKPTPREELSQDKRNGVLAGFQWENNLSVDEMNAEFEKQKAENIAKTDPEPDRQSVEINHLDYVANGYRPMSQWKWKK